MNKDYSQNGESLVIEKLLSLIGIDKPVCLEIGAWDGYHLSNTRYFKDKGCVVDMFDGDPRGSLEVIQKFITVENVKECLMHDYNLLSIDIDGNDYWVLTELLKHQRPDVICFEVNSQIPLDVAKTIKYNPEFFHKGTIYFGMSYAAGLKICHDFGYSIYSVVGNSNIIAANQDKIMLLRDYKCELTQPFPFEEGEWINL